MSGTHFLLEGPLLTVVYSHDNLATLGSKEIVEVIMHQYCKGEEQQMVREHSKSPRIQRKVKHGALVVVFIFSFMHPKRLGNPMYVCVLLSSPCTHSHLFQER